MVSVAYEAVGALVYRRPRALLDELCGSLSVPRVALVCVEREYNPVCLTLGVPD